MRKKYFDLKLSQFSKYLNDIGILSGLDKEQFQKQFYDISSDIYNTNDISSNDYNINFIYFKEYISNTLVYYIKSLSEEKQKLIALNIYMKYNVKEDIIKEKLSKVLKIFSNKFLKSYFDKWKSNDIILTNSLKKTISSHILHNISNLQYPINQKYNFDFNEKNLTNDNININTNNNLGKNVLKTNNSMLNLNSQNLNISTTPDVCNNNNFNNYSVYENSIEDNIINNYTNDKRNKINQINLNELNNTFSINYYKPNNYFNNSNYYNHHFMNNTNYNIKYQYKGRHINNTNTNHKKYNLSKELNISKIKGKVNIEYLNNLSKSKTEHNLIPEKTTQYLKEQEELNNYCTFKPKINKSSSFSRYPNISNKKSIDRLYLDSKNRIARKELQTLKKSNLESKENTFQPKFISSSVKKVKSDFLQRLKVFENIKRNKIKKISKDLEDSQKQQFTFSPKINESPNNKKNNNLSSISKNSSQNYISVSKRKRIPVFKRLYNDNKFKLQRQEQRVKQEMEKIKKNSSIISENNNNKLDTKKIEELYNDYKFKKNRLKIKQEQIEKEQGLTFRPELISEKKFFDKINPDFFEREKQFLEKQQQNKESLKLFLQNEENIYKKKYSEEEKKEIYSSIVTRLYKDGVQKYIQKKNKGNNMNEMNYNNENEIKQMIIVNNNYIKNESEFFNNKNFIKNDIDFEQEPEEEIFKANYENIGMNKDYNKIDFNKNNFFNNSKENNFNVNKLDIN